jgi:non-ribosomal peptide synthetase component E (peptide arylation enzyme)
MSTSRAITTWPACGRPISPADEILIVDADGRPVPDGEPGELLTRGPYTLRGYYRAEGHNRITFTADGFYRSGDLVRRTPSGNLEVVGRIKNQINRGGESSARAWGRPWLLPSRPDCQIQGIGVRSCRASLALADQIGSRIENHR